MIDLKTDLDRLKRSYLTAVKEALRVFSERLERADKEYYAAVRPLREEYNAALAQSLKKERT